jgi:aminoglycoside phosphotransferase (APT) family kinase protein
MQRMHDDELDLDEALVRVLLAEQFPAWAGLSIERVEPSGTDNAIFRLGDQLAVRLARRAGPTEEADKEHDWLPLLAPKLPVELPVPVARGRPSDVYPWYWSVAGWLDGETPLLSTVPAEQLAAFVLALQGIDATSAPPPGARRGEPLASRDGAMRDALERVDAPGALELWEEAVAAPAWDRPRVWMHADLDARNVIVRDGRLTGVIDWGCLGAGDPAVDVMAAWKLVAREERARFRELLGVDDATWLRARGWCVSQAVIALGYYTLDTNPTLVREAERWLVEVLPS